MGHVVVMIAVIVEYRLSLLVLFWLGVILYQLTDMHLPKVTMKLALTVFKTLSPLVVRRLVLMRNNGDVNLLYTFVNKKQMFYHTFDITSIILPNVWCCKLLVIGFQFQSEFLN